MRTRIAFAVLALPALHVLGACGGSSRPDAQAVVDDFSSAGLPVPHARDNSKNCAELGCEQLITTDAVSVYSFTDMDAAAHMAQVAGDGAHHQDGIVLMYVDARKPAGRLRGRTEQVLGTEVKPRRTHPEAGTQRSADRHSVPRLHRKT